MAVENFVFRENWVGSKVAGMKAIFFAIFDPTWINLVAPKGPKNKFLKQDFRNKSRNYIITNFVTLRLTKVKFLKIISVSPFLTDNWAKTWS